MDDRHVSLLDFDLHLIDGTGSAVLSLGLGTPLTPGAHPEKLETLRIALPIAHLHQLLDSLGSAVNYRAKFVPPSSSTH